MHDSPTRRAHRDSRQDRRRQRAAQGNLLHLRVTCANATTFLTSQASRRRRLWALSQSFTPPTILVQRRNRQDSSSSDTSTDTSDEGSEGARCTKLARCLANSTSAINSTELSRGLNRGRLGCRLRSPEAATEPKLTDCTDCLPLCWARFASKRTPTLMKHPKASAASAALVQRCSRRHSEVDPREDTASSNDAPECVDGAQTTCSRWCAETARAHV